MAQDVVVGSVRGKAHIRYCVKQNPIVFLWHRPVIAAQASLKVGQGYRGCICSKSACQRRVGVALDQHRCGFLGDQKLLDGDERLADLRSSGSPAHFQQKVRLPNMQLIQKEAAHVGIEMLSRVNHQDPIAHGANDWCQLDHLWSGTENNG